jgi:hypothetical protein
VPQSDASRYLHRHFSTAAGIMQVPACTP